MTKFISAILAFSSLPFFAQEAQTIRHSSNMREKMALKNKSYINKDKAQTTASSTNSITSSNEKGNLSVTSFSSFSSSANIYGVVNNTTKPLHYNDNVNCVSFIQRKSANYVAAPFNNTGAIVAMISTNWGANWDSTCIYSDGTNFGRYPQGAVYSAPGNTNIANAYVVGSGPCTDGGAWTGNWFASKQLGTTGSTVFSTVASSVTNAQQFFSTAGPFGPTVFSNDWAMYGFASTDDGKVRSLGELTYDPDAVPVEARGAVIQTGSFNAGVFTWSTDSILPPVLTLTTSSRQMNPNAMMAWNETGTVGYVVFIGSKSGQTLSNRGWQPIVYKTTNNGGSWALVAGIDFNSPAFQPIKNRLEAVSTNSNLVIPFFNPYEGIDCTVDQNNKLHIFSVLASTGSDYDDSLAFTNEYTSELYVWPHTNGKQPYLYDFVGDGTGPWSFLLIDSLTSEAPGSQSGSPGFNDNPWDDDAGKVTSDSRIQLSRTPDGKYIIYTWAESDPNFTNGGKFWNNIPNVKARLWSSSSVLGSNLSATEINVTKPSVGSNPFVANKAMFHFTSPSSSTASLTTIVNSATVQVKLPLTVTNSVPYIQGSPNTHYYSTELLSFQFSSTAGINENHKNELQFSLYPNPAQQKCIIAINLKESSNLEISVMNYIGQVIKQRNQKAQYGNNEIELDLSSLISGIYFVNIKNGNTISTSKLVIE